MAVQNGDILQAVVEMVLSDGTIAQNVYTYEAQFATQQDNASVLTSVGAAVSAMYQRVDELISENATFNPLILSKMIYNAQEQAWEVVEKIGEILLTVTPTATDDEFPNQIAPTITANTGRPRSRGRKFIPGFTENTATGSDLDSYALSLLADFAADYVNQIIVGAGDNLIPGIIRTAVEEFWAFTIATVNSIVGTQRRRKPGVGA